MASSGVGRAIYGNGPPSTQAAFDAKDEAAKDASSRKLISKRIPALRVVTSPGERMLYSRDQSEIPRFLKSFSFRSHPDIVVQPLTVDALSAVMRYARSEGLTVVPRGTGSSPFGGSVPVIGGMVVDMSRMDRIGDIDMESRTITVEAGARWADIDQALLPHGLRVPTCPSSKFSTVGGWIATGGMGLNSYSKGHLSRHVRSLEVMSPDGTLRRFSQTDPDFESIFGSEGQVGVITKATIAADALASGGRPHLMLFSTSSAAFEFADELMRSDVEPAHIFYGSASKIGIISQLLDGKHLRRGDGIVVSLEDAASEERFENFMAERRQTQEPEYVARYMWNERFFPMKIRGLGPGLLGTEVVVPQSRLQHIVDVAKKISACMSLEPLFEIHYLPEGEALVLCFFLVDQGNTFSYTLDAVKSMVLARALVDSGGRPYSIGIWNNPFTDSADVGDITRLRELKAKLDPLDMMNSGKYFHLSGRWAGLGALMFHPRLMRPALRLIIAFSPVSTTLLGRMSSLLRKWFDPKSRDRLIAVADDCAMCGSCVGVCPAYALIGDERVTARGKMLTAKAMAGGFSISSEHAGRTSLCMRCKACEQVCQSRLELIPAYDELERRLERLHGRNEKEIERFVRFAEDSQVYDDLVMKGLVVGAPRNRPGGASDDV
ncbi:MAG: FAD-binding protein [Methanobacteriota archaeon]|nr:MAG: FAD-binding protein [Euryarchaeota archaeon]